MQHLSSIDWLVILTYLVGVIALGAWVGRGRKSTRDYFLGNRNITWWAVGLSIVATETSALTFIGVPAAAYAGNLGFIQIVIGYVIARVILAVVMVPRYFRGEIYSPYELLSDAFGPGARQAAAVFFLIAGTLAAGVRVYVTCIPIQLIFGFADSGIIFAILLFVILSLTYTYLGGVKSVIWTDALQFGLLLAGGLFALFYVPGKLAGGWNEAVTAAGDAGKLAWFNGGFSLSAPFNIWMGVIGGTVQVLASHGMDQLNVQRVLTCRNVSEGRKALMLSAVIILPLFLLFLVVGVLLWTYYQQHQMLIPIPETTRPGENKNDYVFPIFIITEMPPVFRGLLVVAILSAAMSSVSSALSALASVSVMDLWKTWRGRVLDDAATLRLGRLATLGWAVALVLVAWWSQHTASVLSLAFGLNGLTAGGLLAALILSLWWRRGRSLPVVGGMFVSLLVMAWVSRLKWTAVVNGIEVERSIYWPWFTLIGTVVALAAAVALRALFRERSHHHASR